MLFISTFHTCRFNHRAIIYMFLVYLLTYFERINQSLITDYDENVYIKHLRSRKLEYILKLSNTFYDSGIYLTEHLFLSFVQYYFMEYSETYYRFNIYIV